MTSDGRSRGLLGAFQPDVYVGQLGTGPAMPSDGFLLRPLSGQLPETHRDHLRREQEARLPLLFAEFGIDSAAPDAWERLARALAERHVPGFQWALSVDLTPDGKPLPVLNPNYYTGNHNPYLPPFGLSTVSPGHRQRGRPRKARGLLGLLGWSVPKRAGGRPSESRESKAEMVQNFDVFKARQGSQTTDEQAAEIWLMRNRPELNAYHRRSAAKQAVRRIRRLRHELKRFENPPEKSA